MASSRPNHMDYVIQATDLIGSLFTPFKYRLNGNVLTSEVTGSPQHSIDTLVDLNMGYLDFLVTHGVQPTILFMLRPFTAQRPVVNQALANNDVVVEVKEVPRPAR